MFKKAIPFVLASGLVLTACGNGVNNNTTPNRDETPMENLNNGTRDLTPRVNDNQTGPNMDGVDDGRVNNNGVLNNDNNGVIRDNNILDDNTRPNGK